MILWLYKINSSELDVTIPDGVLSMEKVKE